MFPGALAGGPFSSRPAAPPHCAGIGHWPIASLGSIRTGCKDVAGTPAGAARKTSATWAETGHGHPATPPRRIGIIFLKIPN